MNTTSTNEEWERNWIDSEFHWWLIGLARGTYSEEEIPAQESNLKQLINKVIEKSEKGAMLRQRLVMQETSYTPRTAVRRLEELAEEGKLLVEYRKGHAFYKAAPKPSKEELVQYARQLVREFNA